MEAPGPLWHGRIDGVVDGRLTGTVRYAATPDLAVMLSLWVDARPPRYLLAVERSGDDRRFAVKLDATLISAREVRVDLAATGETLARGRLVAGASGYVWEGVADQDEAISRAEVSFARNSLVSGFATPSPQGVPTIVDLRADDGYVRSALAGGGDARFDLALDPHHRGKLDVALAATGEVFWQRPGQPQPVPPLDPAIEPAAVAAAAARVAKAAATYARWLRECDVSRPAFLAAAAETLAAEPRRRLAVIVVSRIFGAGEDVAAAWRRTLSTIAAQLHRPSLVILPADAPDPGAVDDAGVAVHRASSTRLADLAAIAGEGHVACVVAGDRLAPAALLIAADALAAGPAAPFLYSDEDRIDAAGRRSDPWFKGAWDADLAAGQDYHARLATTSAVSLATGAGEADANRHGLALALLAIADRSAVPPRHLACVLVHRDATEEPADPERDRSLADHIERLIAARAATGTPRPLVQPLRAGERRVHWRLPEAPPLVSVLVPTRDRVDLLAQCVRGVLEETRYPAVEVIILDNDSTEPATLRYFDEISRDPRVRVERVPGPFNYSAINNRGAEIARGTLLLLLNNDIKVIGPEWLEEMVALAIRPGIGAVGAKLLYGDGRIQHVGVGLGIGGVASHPYKLHPGDSAGMGGKLRLTHEAAAVTAACMLVPRAVWRAVGGLGEEFPIAYNDVDLCLRIRRAGYRILMAPDACLYHLESASRGREDTDERQARLAADKARMIERWRETLACDPFLGPNWSRRSTDPLPDLTQGGGIADIAAANT